ncbi:peroxiredoxin V protein [Salpingoeca rosetta]|uniref:Peroxiredoxin V protein n=1 Tax=Salpingoeca rosetta (strain ATCC 50818 / BSB-021) TaxID=946362 RepID=F2UG13_SALR5|nr:peroxiredoxin V protein [Salpingoeca rosetta]EGD75441.1 peroxiredoxin V protein [Salpingoeca rosetta]|eukprot:XP_004991898.1 peroxiredoxin V protein [Salpingoeca rosetta]
MLSRVARGCHSSLLQLADATTAAPVRSLAAKQLLHQHRTMASQVKVGDSLPDIKVSEGPGNDFSIRSLFDGKKGILFGVPGAFTPGCSRTHLPGYVQRHDDLKAKGYDVLACVAVNDPFVMEAWGKDQKVDGKVRMLSDTCAELTKALGLELDAVERLGNVRCRRFALVIDDNVVKAAQIEEGGAMTCSLAENVIDLL